MAGSTMVVGLDGSEASERVLDLVRAQVKIIGDCEVVAVYVIEWSPFTFQTAEENEQRHRRREEEIQIAQERVVQPAVEKLRAEGLNVTGEVHHGDVADILERIAEERGATQIIVGRVGSKGMVNRIFGGVSGRLVAQSSVPVTIVP